MRRLRDTMKVSGDDEKRPEDDSEDEPALRRIRKITSESSSVSPGSDARLESHIV